MQRHGDVEVEGVVVDHADGEEHCHHEHIISGERRGLGDRFRGGGRTGGGFFGYLIGIAGFFLPKFDSKIKPSKAMKRN